MLVIGIDTATVTAGAAIVRKEAQPKETFRVLAEFSLNTGKTHSQRFLPMVEAMLQAAEMTLSDMDAIAVTAGPGSFTGLRIGISTAKAWGQALQKPIYAISTLAALASAVEYDGLVCPILDARKQQVYTALFAGGTRLLPDTACSLEEIMDKVAALERPVMFCGDGVPVYEKELNDQFGENYIPAPRGRLMFPALGAAYLSLRAEVEPVSAFTLKANYLRLSEAERHQKEAQKK